MMGSLIFMAQHHGYGRGRVVDVARAAHSLERTSGGVRSRLIVLVAEPQN
jgi:hypothetical protein